MKQPSLISVKIGMFGDFRGLDNDYIACVQPWLRYDFVFVVIDLHHRVALFGVDAQSVYVQWKKTMACLWVTADQLPECQGLFFFFSLSPKGQHSRAARTLH